MFFCGELADNISSPFLIFLISGFFFLFFLCQLFLPLLFFCAGFLQALFDLNRMGFDFPAELYGVPQLFELLCEDTDLRGIRLITVEFPALF